MSHIVAIDCSPRSNASTVRSEDAFLDGAMGLSTNTVSLHRLLKLKSIQDCRRCMLCKRTGKCSIDDDIGEILDDIKKADCVVFSTPVYFKGPSALYKMVEDRMFCFLDEEGRSTLKSGKKAVLIVTGDYPDSDIEEVANVLSSNLETIGFDMLGIITYCDEQGKKPVDDNNALLQEVKSLGLQMRNTPTV